MTNVDCTLSFRSWRDITDLFTRASCGGEGLIKIHLIWLLILIQINVIDEVFGLHLKLHPGIWCSHPANKVCFPPSLFSKKHDMHLKGLCFKYDSGSLDWNYPVDLCGGLYRISDIKSIVGVALETFGEGGLASPNLVELNMNKAFRTSPLAIQYKLGFSMPSPLLNVVTVNRVQSTFKVPFHKTAEGDVETLNKMFMLPFDSNGNGNWPNSAGAVYPMTMLPSTPSSSDPHARPCFDLDKYFTSCTTTSVHIGSLHWRTPSATTSESIEGHGVEVRRQC